MSQIDLKAYLDGELSPAERREVELQLDQSEAAQRELEQLRAIGQAVSQVQYPATTGYEATMAALRGTRKRTWWAFKHPGLAAAFAGCAFIALAILITPPEQSSAEAGLMTAAYSSPNSANPNAGYLDESNGALATKSMAPQTAPERSRQFSGQMEASTPAAVAEDQSYPALKGMPAKAKREGTPSRLAPQIEKNASLNLLVTDVVESAKQVTKIAQSLGGSEVNSQIDRSDSNGIPSVSATVSIKVPVAKFDEAKRRLTELGELLGQSSNESDVTESVIDNDARLKALRAEEQQYLKIMQSAKVVKDILQVQGQLSRVRAEIESLVRQQANLKDRTQMSELTVDLQQRPTVTTRPMSGNWLQDSATRSWQLLQSKTRRLVERAIKIAIFAPLWIPIVIFGWWAWRRFRNRPT